ncbi:hypothetical protein [Roseiconus lacunae]|uniref:hypothetical protein n=1 Tax=Roseiconus lacunae TaxID=2605694 RepID=UPI001E586144|nr:hypothetical protein [Roseiconus lacunae]
MSHWREAFVGQRGSGMVLAAVARYHRGTPVGRQAATIGGTSEPNRDVGCGLPLVQRSVSQSKSQPNSP